MNTYGRVLAGGAVAFMGLATMAFGLTQEMPIVAGVGGAVAVGGVVYGQRRWYRRLARARQVRE